MELTPTLLAGTYSSMKRSLPPDLKDLQPIPPDVFGRRVLRLRLKRKLRQVQLAESVGIDRADLCNLEKGRGPRNPSSALVLRLAAALGVTPNELMV